MTEASHPPRCAVHPASAAQFTCSRCGAFACAACTSSLEAVCLACYTRPADRLGASRRARVALLLAVLALHGLLPLAPVALWLVSQERQAITEHAAPRGGEPWLVGARWVSFAALAGWTLALGSLLARWLDA